MKLKEALTRLEQSGIEPAEAKIIAESVFEISRSELFLRLNDEIGEGQFDSMKKIAEKRKEHYPLQYLLGKWPFMGFDFSVGEGVLIPRPETEELTQRAIESLQSEANVLDLCAGSGCIGLSIAKKTNAKVTLIEKSCEAFEYLKQNAKALKVEATLIQGDIFDFDEGCLPNFDLIISNPPYIQTDEIDGLQPEVKFEPRLALDGGDDGLEFFHCIAEKWAKKLKPGGRLMLECGENQANEIVRLLGGGRIAADFYGTERFVEFQKSIDTCVQ